MYTPAHYLMEEREELLSFIQQYSFATIVNTKDGMPVATHLPFVVSVAGEKIFLEAHFARANEQWQLLEDEQDTLVIFTEPHAYISPSHYDKQQNVPTWNYQAVHLYGRARVIKEEEEGFALLERLIATYEKKYQAQWARLSMEYKQAMLAGIVPFVIEVTRIQAKAKLSQNKKLHEQERIANTLVRATDSAAREIGQAMMRNIAKAKKE